MKIIEILSEGGWSSKLTQDTIITPQTIADVIPVMKEFEILFNKHLGKENIPPIRIGNPVGSGTYYKRDLMNNPDKEYGDIDVQFIIKRDDKLTASATLKIYFDSVKRFCEQNDNYTTNTGIHVIFQIGDDYIQKARLDIGVFI